MKLSELNEEIQFNKPPEGVLIFVDERSKKFRLATDRDAKSKTQEIGSLMDYRKVAKKYGAEISKKEWDQLKKKSKKDRKFKQMLAAMEDDLKDT